MWLLGHVVSLPRILGKVFPSSVPLCWSLHTPFLFQHIPGLSGLWSIPCQGCTFTWQCQLSVKALKCTVHFRTLWCNLLGVVGILSCCSECTYWHSVYYPLSVGCNSFSLPMWVDFSLGYPEGGELAFLQLSFFFNFSPSEVVANEIWNISKKRNFQEIKTYKKWKQSIRSDLSQLFHSC